MSRSESDDRGRSSDRRSKSSSSSNSSSNKRKEVPESSSERSTTGGRNVPRGRSTQASQNEDREKVKRLTLLAMAKEEKQGLSRSPDADYNLFKEKCQDMKSLLTKIRTEGDPKNELKVEVALSFMELKQLNRYDKYRVKSLRDAVSTKRTKVDEFHLKLQNLLYEVIFLEKEIKRSLDYTSKADEIDLIDLETFLKEASSEFTGDTKTRKDEHQLTLNRLEYELKQRITLAEEIQQKELLNREDMDEVKKMQELLARLRSCMTCVVEALKPAAAELTGGQEEMQDQEMGADEDVQETPDQTPKASPRDQTMDTQDTEDKA